MTLTWLMSVDICIALRDYSKNIKTGSFQLTLWLSSPVEVVYVYSWWMPLCWLKAPHVLSFLWAISSTRLSTDMSQVGVTLFPRFLNFLSFYLSRFSLYIIILLKKWRDLRLIGTNKHKETYSSPTILIFILWDISSKKVTTSSYLIPPLAIYSPSTLNHFSQSSEPVTSCQN